MKLISTLIFLLCVTFAFAECYDNHFDECRIERQNGKYGIVIDKQLAIPYEYDEIVPQHNCFSKSGKAGNMVSSAIFMKSTNGMAGYRKRLAGRLP